MSVHPVPPGPNGMPLVGVLPRYARDPFRFVTDLREAYGDVSAFDLGPNRTYLLTNPAAIERVLVSEEETFSKPTFGTDALDELLGEGLLLSDGETWRTRRTMAGPAFAPDRIASLAPTMVERAESLVERWEDGAVRNVEWEMTRTTLEIIVETMFGVDLSPGTARLIGSSLEPIGTRFEPDPRRAVVPDWLPTPENREFSRCVRRLESIVDDLVTRRMRVGVNDGDSDLLAHLLRAQERGKIDERGIRDELVTMLLAGHDTTALVLTYTFALLSDHPEFEARIHEEVETVLDGRSPTAADVRALTEVRNAIRESMRLYPPVYATFRRVERDVELGGYPIPEDSLVLLSQWATHRDPRFFEDPDTFDPDRWRDPDHPTYAYFPFGAGPRSCIGKGFATLEASIILSVVAGSCRLRRVDTGEITLRGSLTAHPEHGMDMRIERRT